MAIQAPGTVLQRREGKLSNKPRKCDSGGWGKGAERNPTLCKRVGRVQCVVGNGLGDLAWEKARRESDYVLSREVGMYKGPEAGDGCRPGTEVE